LIFIFGKLSNLFWVGVIYDSRSNDHDSTIHCTITKIIIIILGPTAKNSDCD